MPKIIHTIKFADGAEAKRESATRRYTHVAVATYTQAQADRNAAELRKAIADQEANLARLRALVTPEDAVEHARCVAKLARQDALPWTERSSIKAWFALNHAKYETATQQVMDLEPYLRNLRIRLECVSTGVGKSWALGWSTSASGAAKMAQDHLKYHALDQVAVRADISYREVQPRAKKAK